ncbi:hypothetical protein D3C77_224600 [compost metagenome]
MRPLFIASYIPLSGSLIKTSILSLYFSITFNVPSVEPPSIIIYSIFLENSFWEITLSIVSSMYLTPLNTTVIIDNNGVLFITLSSSKYISTKYIATNKSNYKLSHNYKFYKNKAYSNSII